MARTKLTTNNHCHKPIKGGAPVEELIASTKQGRQACLDYLAGRHPDVICSDNGIGALHALVRKGSGSIAEQEVMDILLSLGANPNARNLRGQTPLLCAVHAGSWWALPKLQAAGADLDASDNLGRTTFSLMEGWLARHPGEEDNIRKIRAQLSHDKMQDHVAPAAPTQKSSSKRF